MLTRLGREPEVPSRHFADALIGLNLHSLWIKQLATGGPDPRRSSPAC